MNDKKILVIRKNKGKFCTVYGDDANIISSLFGYKILNNNKVGFPESILNKVINTLEDNKISYMVIYIDKDPLVKDFKKLNNYEVYKNFQIFYYIYLYQNSLSHLLYSLSKKQNTGLFEFLFH